MNAIEAEKLSRFFNGRQAVDNISFSVAAGEIFGFLGHNGAGKKLPRIWAYLAVVLVCTVIAFAAAAWALHRRHN